MIKNALGLFVFAIIVLLMFLPSYTKLQDLKQKNSEYRRQIEQLTKKNAELVEERHRLEDDPVYLEKVAREKMGLIREGEVMYKIVPPRPQTAQVATVAQSVKPVQTVVKPKTQTVLTTTKKRSP